MTERKITRCSSVRQKHNPANEAAAAAVPAPFPGLAFRMEFPSGRSMSIDFSVLGRPGVAEQAARLVWAGYQDGSIRSKGIVGDYRRALKALEAFLGSHECKVAHLGDIDGTLVDRFERHVRDCAEGTDSSVPEKHLSSLLSLLRRAIEAGYAPRSLEHRCSYTSKLPARARVPRDAYDDLTMAGMVKGARKDVEDINARLENGRRLAATGRDPESEPNGWERPFNVLWYYVNRGLPDRERRDWITAFYRNTEWPASKLSSSVFPRIVDLVPFLILLCHDNGLPVESNHELKIDCLADRAPRTGDTKLSYIKRRRQKDEKTYTLDVGAAKPHSTGWLVNALRVATAPIRSKLGFGENEGPLFLCFAHRRLVVANINHYARQAWLRDHPVVAHPDGALLDQLVLARIRKTKKALVARATGGNLKRIANDHKVRTCFDHYIKIPFLKERLEEATEAGIAKALAAATPIRVLDTKTKQAVRSGEQGAAPRLGIDAAQMGELIDGTNDVIIASCTGFRASPYAPPGSACGAPLFGCLDCRNAVFTPSRLPNLITLLNHFVALRQQMSLEVWASKFRFAFTRALQILDKFPPADIAAAMAEIEDGAGREWTSGQIILQSSP